MIQYEGTGHLDTVTGEPEFQSDTDRGFDWFAWAFYISVLVAAAAFVAVFVTGSAWALAGLIISLGVALLLYWYEFL
jgi:hypothetical protein